ncbi:FMN-binding protein [Clostridium rectalis]|uniref:FMN-binding protein n=1 Tax=Clostridium rectalis TaxID=2040295 RepID=UPI000F6439AB|nr:FMN-binding protein [Clostridium rectalis]
MKKISGIVLCIAMTMTLFAGCASSNDGNKGAKDSKETKTITYKDGKYKASYDKADSHGWKAFVELEVKNGKISAVDFDYLSKDNKRKTEDRNYNETMKKSKSKTSPKEFCPKLEKNLVEKQDLNKVDGVSGATSSVENFKALAKAALENASKGETKETIVPLKE